MRPTPEHGPCGTCPKYHDGRCAETNALVSPDGGRHCPLYPRPRTAITEAQERQLCQILAEEYESNPIFRQAFDARAQRLAAGVHKEVTSVCG